MSTRSYPPGTVLMRPQLDPLARKWWLMLIRGIAAIVFGVLTFVWPVLTLFTLVLLYGAFALIDGVLSLAAAFTSGGTGRRWWLAIAGVLGVVVGVLTLAWPDISTLALLYLIAAWAVFSGVLMIAGSFDVRRAAGKEWLLLANGLLSLAFGLLLAAFPASGALGLVFVIGAFAVVYGVLLTGFALRLRKMAEVKI